MPVSELLLQTKNRRYVATLKTNFVQLFTNVNFGNGTHKNKVEKTIRGNHGRKVAHLSNADFSARFSTSLKTNFFLVPYFPFINPTQEILFTTTQLSPSRGLKFYPSCWRAEPLVNFPTHLGFPRPRWWKFHHHHHLTESLTSLSVIFLPFRANGNHGDQNRTRKRSIN